MHYQDFELEIFRNGTDAGYIAKVRSSQGEAQQSFSLPDAVTLENLILKMRGFSRSSRAANCPEVQAASRFGELLFSNAFGGEISNLLKSCLDQTSNDKGLRIKLILQDAPELSTLPWEYLYLPTKRDFLAHSPATPIVRYLKHATAIKPLAVTLPLKLLVMIASPTDKAWLDTEAERRALELALADLVKDGTLQITWLEHATVDALAAALDEDTFHLLHYIGHSYFDDKLGEGALVLENAAGKSHYYDATYLKVLLHDHHTLRLVVLNSCEGAMQDKQDPFSSIATTLMLAGIPAVIAMQFEISDAAAISFARVFYKWLAKGVAIDEAVGRVRKHLFAVEGNNVEWGTPVLYLRAKDGVLFTVDSKMPEQSMAEKPAQGKVEPENSIPGAEQAATQITSKNYIEGNVSGGNVAGNDITTVGEDVVSGNKTEIHYHYASQGELDQEKLAHEKEIKERLEREELERQQKLQQEKLAQERAEQLKKWKKYLTNALFVVVATLLLYAVFYGVSVAYNDYTEHQAIVEKQKAREAKAEAERKAALAKQQEEEQLKQAAAAKIKAQKDADAQAEADRKAALAKQQKEAIKQAENLRLEAEKMFLQASNYAKGENGVAQNFQLACEWFKKAADAGHQEGKKYSRSKRCKGLI